MPSGRFDRIIESHPRAALARERVQRVVSGRVPDRVPFIDHYWNEFAQRYVSDRGLPPDTSLEERFDHDLLLLAPRMGPWPREARELGREDGGWILSRDEYGLVVRSHETRQTVEQQIDCRIHGREDLARLPFEDPADPARCAGMAEALEQACNRFCPVFKLGGPFSRTWRLRGLQRFLEDIAADEPFVAELTERMTDHLIAVGRAAVERLDWPRVQMHIADDHASTFAPLLAPRSFQRIFLPNLRRMVDAFHALGFRVSYESEGNVSPMLDLLERSGIDGLAHMEPRAGMTIGGIRKRFGSRFFVMCNVCNTLVLPSNDRAAIAREVHRVLSSAVDGGLMGLSAHSVSPDVSSDSYDWFFGLMDRFGRYPIRLEALEEQIEELEQ